MEWIKSGILGIIMLTHASVIAQSPLSNQYSLESAIQFAQSNHQSIRQAQLNVEDAQQQIRERKSIGLPHLDGSIGYTYFPTIPSTLLPKSFFPTDSAGNLPPGTSRLQAFGVKSTLEGKATLSSLLFDGSYLVGLEGARMYRDFSNLNVVMVKHQIRKQVTEAYLPVAFLQSSIHTLDKNLSNLDKLLREIQAMNKQGFVEQLDVDRLQLSKANLESEKENLQVKMRMAQNYLRMSIGIPPTDSIDILRTDSLEALYQQVPPPVIQSNETPKQRAEYQLAEMNVQLNEVLIKLGKWSYLPSVAAFGSATYSRLGDNLKDNFWTPGLIVGFSANVPIFDGFQRKAQIQRAKIGTAIATSKLDQAKQGILTEIKNAGMAYQDAWKRIEVRKSNVQLAEKIYNVAQIKYRNGTGSSMEITQAEQALYSAQQNFIQSQYDLVTAWHAWRLANGMQ